MSAPFILQELCGRVFMLNQETGALWEIDRGQFTVWNCVSQSPVAAPKAAPAPSSDRNELVGTDTAVIDGVEYHGQFQPSDCGSPCADPPDPGQPDAEGLLEIRKREGLHTYTLVFRRMCPTRQNAWEVFDAWVGGRIVEASIGNT